MKLVIEERITDDDDFYVYNELGFWNKNTEQIYFIDYCGQWYDWYSAWSDREFI